MSVVDLRWRKLKFQLLEKQTHPRHRVGWGYPANTRKPCTRHDLTNRHRSRNHSPLATPPDQAQFRTTMPAHRAPLGPIQQPKPRLSERVRKAIALLEDGTCRTQIAAAERAGCNASHLNRVLHSAEGQAFLARKRAGNIAHAALRASAKLADLVDADSEHVSAEVSLKTLALAGHVPEERHHHRIESVAVGYIVSLESRPGEDGPEDRGEVVDVRPEPPAPVFSASPAGSALEQTTVRAKAEPELVPRPALEDRPAEPSPSWPGERTIDDDERADMQRRLGAARVARRLRGEADDEPD